MIPRRKHKYNAKPMTVGGIRFASTKEAHRYKVLKILEASGALNDLVLQPTFVLNAYGGGKVGTYRADFQYEMDGERVVEDVKGVKTPMYKWKKKHTEAQYGIKITET